MVGATPVASAWSANSEYILKNLFDATTLRKNRPLTKSLISAFWAPTHEISSSVILNRNNFGSSRLNGEIVPLTLVVGETGEAVRVREYTKMSGAVSICNNNFRVQGNDQALRL